MSKTKLQPGWKGWYTKRGGTVWFRCEIVAWDDGEPVIKTKKGYYYRRPRDEYDYATEIPATGVTN